jgi:hypothetical protein
MIKALLIVLLRWSDLEQPKADKSAGVEDVSLKDLPVVGAADAKKTASHRGGTRNHGRLWNGS